MSRLRRLRYRTRSVLSGHPALYLAFAARKYSSGESVVGSDTELVIDGFQRSGNTFATSAFQLSQHRPVRLAHHLHAAAQIIRAAKMNIPTLLLIREPEGAILSHLVREPDVHARDALAHYVRLHRGVLPYGDRFVVADFSRTTTDFGSVIDDVNAKFGTEFDRFEHTPENQDRCFKVIEERNKARYGDIDEHTVPRPSAERQGLVEIRREEYRSPELNSLRSKAEDVYATLLRRQRAAPGGRPFPPAVPG